MSNVATTSTPYQAALAAVEKRTGKKRTVLPAKAKNARPKKSTGNGSGPHQRLTDTWPSKSGRDVAVKDRIKTAEGVVIDVIGRWTKKTAKGNVPMVTGHVVSFPAGATLAEGGKGKKVGDRCNAVAASSTHVKPAK